MQDALMPSQSIPLFTKKEACEVSGHQVADHFADVSKMVDHGSGSQRQIDDIMLTRYACLSLNALNS